MVTVDVRHEDRSEVGRRRTDSSHADEGSWRGVDDVLAVEHRKRMMSAVGKECISGPQHHDAVVHEGR